MSVFVAYLASAAGGWLITGIAVFLMRQSIGYPRPFFRWLDVWLGGTERAIATTLVIWAPSLLGLFVGGWTALKLALNWQRQQIDGAPQMAQVALVGSAISFAIAIAAGLAVHPESLATFSKAP